MDAWWWVWSLVRSLGTVMLVTGSVVLALAVTDLVRGSCP